MSLLTAILRNPTVVLCGELLGPGALAPGEGPGWDAAGKEIGPCSLNQARSCCPHSGARK